MSHHGNTIAIVHACNCQSNMAKRRKYTEQCNWVSNNTFAIIEIQVVNYSNNHFYIVKQQIQSGKMHICITRTQKMILRKLQIPVLIKSSWMSHNKV